MVTENTFPTEVIDLPSTGWFYPEGSPLASGQIELKYMTAREEDILTSRNLITKGLVIDKLLEALIVNPLVKLDDVLLGDKAAIMVGSRILGYGKNYEVSIPCPECEKKLETTIDLQDIPDKECPYFLPEYKGRNEFPLGPLPITKKHITIKFLTNGDERGIRAELEGLKRALKSDVDREVTTRLRRIITSIDGVTDGEPIRHFVDTLPARDAMYIRDHIRKSSPDIDLRSEFSCTSCGYEGRVDIPIDVNFFWPNATV
jgi:hypothetical protein